MANIETDNSERQKLREIKIMHLDIPNSNNAVFVKNNKILGMKKAPFPDISFILNFIPFTVFSFTSVSK